MNLREAYALHSDEEFLKFERVTNRRSQRPDLHAFLLLDEILPPEMCKGKPSEAPDMVAAGEHDIIYLAPDPEKLGEVITEEQFIELVRCGVMYDSETDSLAMFV